MQRAVSLLARREHSRAELRRKLLRHLPPDGEAESVDRVLDQLIAKDMLSDARFVQSRVRVRGQRYGVARIRQELRQHGLGAEVVGSALAPLSQTEFERAWSVWERKFGAAPADEPQRARQMRFLAARGFSPDTVFRVMKKARTAGG
jgi:regulatory protein